MKHKHSFSDIESLDLYNLAPCGFFSYFPNGSICRINDTLLGWLGYQREEVEGVLTFLDLLNIGGKIFYETHYSPRLIQNKSIREINFDFLAKDKRKIPVLVNTQSVLRENGEVVVNNSSVTDISERKLYEVEILQAKKKYIEISKNLEKTNTELSNYAKLITHDIKSPIANIIGVIDLARTEGLDFSVEDFKNYLQMIGDSANKLDNLVNTVSEFYLNDKLLHESNEEVSLEELISNIVGVVDPEGKIIFDINLSEKKIIVNTGMLTQVLLNLVTNGCKYNDKPLVKIGIRFFREGLNYIFSIEDNGIGIEEKDVDKLFTMFATLGEKDRFQKNGTGLGLASVKRMILQLGGEISVKSKVHHGSVFTFSIPVPSTIQADI